MRVSFVYRGYESIGIQMLSAGLRRAGHETRLHFDPLLFNDMLLSNARLARLFSHRDDLIRSVVQYAPGVVCFSCVTFDYAWARSMAAEIKSVLPGVRTVFGGIHVTSMPDAVLAQPGVDYIIIGEADEALVELVNALESGTPTEGIANVGKAGGVVNPPRPFIQNLDALPFADKELYYNVHPLFRIGYTIISGRGCPNNCSYCHNNIQRRLYGAKDYLRRRSVGSVIAELELAKKTVAPFIIRFSDDNLCYDINWLRAFADEYPRRVGIPFWCFVHPGSATEATIETLKRAGCIEVQMGVQTLEEDVRRNVIKRSESKAQIAAAIDGFRAAGIRISTDFIMNLPGHNEDSAVEASQFFAAHPPNRIHTFWLTYFPSLDITQYAVEHGIVSPDIVEKQSEGASPNTFFLGGSAFDKAIAKTQVLFLLASLQWRRMADWLTTNRRYRRIPLLGFTLYWFLTYAISLFTFSKKNDLYGKRMKRRYVSYAPKKLFTLLGLRRSEPGLVGRAEESA